MKTTKILDYCNNGFRLVCIKHLEDKTNPYRVYRVWYDMGWHRKELVRYADALSVMCYAADLVKRYERG